MGLGTVNGTFIYNGQPQNGATAKLWKITAFASYADSTDTVQDNPLAATAIELNVTNGGLFAVGDVLRMQIENVKITAISTNKLYIIRAWQGTAAAAHVQTTQIDDQTITPPEQDDAEPGAGQQGGSVTTGVAYGGDGGYRFDAVPSLEYYASVEYDTHRSWLYAFVEEDDPTLKQILNVDGDLLIRNADTEVRLPKGTLNDYLKQGANRPFWSPALASGVTFVRKTADETVNNSAVMQNDDHLLFAVGTTEFWYFYCFLIHANLVSATADLKVQFTVPAGGTLLFTDHISIHNGGVGADMIPNADGIAESTARAYDCQSVIAVEYIQVWGWYLGAGTAGNVQLQWAQNAAEANDTKLLTNSFLITQKLN